ncbi:hypothetical protein BCR42DRAFT_421787 [Absidia repens]|uniref:Rhomboid-type serine protease n=1 Tax=Absidia repens TaxID=90262 RepID=A0A1X2I7X1_9FUNG|nr:hypothetical protein BCR42DRAFT_421787 [Absidia repens]
MSQFIKEKFNFKLSKKSTNSLNLPIQRCESPIPTGSPYYHHYHNGDAQPIHDIDPYQFYNKRAKETQTMTSNQHYIDGSPRIMVVDDTRKSKTEKNVNDDNDIDQYHSYRNSNRRNTQNRFRSTILSLLPASKRKSQSSDRVYLISGNSDLESNYQDRGMENTGTATTDKEKKKVTFFKTPTATAQPTLNSKPPSPPPETARPVMAPPPKQHRRWFPFFSYLFAIGTFILLVYDIFLFKKDYGTIINLSPFNIMLGPNTETFIQSGALFTSCIRADQTSFQCTLKTGQPSTLTPPTWSFSLDNSTNSSNTHSCSIQDLCGLVPTSSDDTSHPGQYYRFFTAIAIHGGIIHWIINVTVLLTFGASIERGLNPFRFAFVWIVSGSFGYVLASLFLNDNTAIMGCFGAINGIFGLALINLYHARHFSSNSGTFLLKLIMLLALGGILGYLPGYNNFSHIGGFIAGILSGIVVVPTTLQFRVNKLGWFLVLLIRMVALAVLGILFYFALTKFYSNQNLMNDCPWCSYISCLPIFNMCSSH